MRSSFVFLGVLLGALMHPAVASAVCFPVKTDIVSLGERSARSYAERSLNKHIEDQRRVLKSTGAAQSRVVKRELSCKPFPNVLGADEWRCIGQAKVCSKS